MSEYANPAALVETQWLAARLDDPALRLVEVNVEPEIYEKGHVKGNIKGSVRWNWQTDLQDQLTRDIPDRQAFQALMRRSGIRSDHHVVLYGDHHNWFAAYAYWLLKLYRHPTVSLMNGGRGLWEAEGRPFVEDEAEPEASDYRAAEPDLSLRAHWQEVRQALDRDVALVDVRSPAEFTGDLMAPPGLQETAQRGGHIPGAVNVPWSQVVTEQGLFKDAQALRGLYSAQGIEEDDAVITYCRIGERSSHTWFVLTELLGIQDVRNYDGSWTEWGSMVGNPIER